MADRPSARPLRGPNRLGGIDDRRLLDLEPPFIDTQTQMGVDYSMGNIDVKQIAFGNGATPDMQRYLKQMQLPGWPLPDDTFEQTAKTTAEKYIWGDISPEALRTYLNGLRTAEVITFEKATMYSLRMEESDGEPDKYRNYIEKTEEAVLIAAECFFRREDRDLLFIEKVNDYAKRGMLNRHPELAAGLLETGLRKCIGSNGLHRYEIFDSYIDFTGKNGLAKRAADFISANIDLILKMESGRSKVFLEVVTKNNRIRLELIKRVFEEGEKSSVKKHPPSIATYIVNYCIKYKGDYKEAARVFEKSKGILDDKQKAYISSNLGELTPPFLNGDENDLRNAEGDVVDEMTRSTEINLAEIRDLAGHLAELPADLNEDTAMQYLQKNRIRSTDHAAASKRIRARIGILTLRDHYKAVVGETDMAAVKEKMLYVMNMPGLDYGIYFKANRLICDEMLNLETKPLDQVIAFANMLISIAEEVNFPVEIINVVVARLAEAHYKMQDYGEVIKCCEKAQADGYTLLRGARFYLAKALLNTQATEEEDHTEKAIRAIEPALVEFTGSQFERGVWQELVVPYFYEHRAIILAKQKHSHAIGLLRTMLEEYPDNALLMTALVQLECASSVVKSELLDHVIEMNGCSGTGEEKATRRAVTLEASRKFLASGSYASAASCIKSIKGYEEDAEICVKLVGIILSKPEITLSDFREAERIATIHPSLHTTLEGQFNAAREKLKIQKITPIGTEDYLHSVVANKSLTASLGMRDPVQVAARFGAIRELANVYRGTLGSAAEVDMSKLQVDRQIVNPYKVLLEIFGIETIHFRQRANKGITAVCILKSENPLEKMKLEVELDSNLRLEVEGEKINADTGISRLLMRVLEAALLQEMVDRLIEVDHLLVEGASYGSSEKYEALKQLVKEYYKGLRPFEVEGKGLAALEERNRLVVAPIEKNLERFARDPNFPTEEELDGIIASYIELLRTSRDLERPVTFFQSGVDTANPLYAKVKYLKIFSPELAQKTLAAMGIERDEAQSSKNNFEGYYELICFFDEGVEGKISVFLDERGEAYIPGVDKSHPLYKQLQMLVLECLAKRTVSELRPFARMVKQGRGPNTDPEIKKVGGVRNLDRGIDPQALRRRIACSILVFDKKIEEPGVRQPRRKLQILDEICETFNLVDLSEKDITEWPTFLKVGKKYVKIEGLFARIGDKTHINIAKFKEELGDTGEFEQLSAEQETLDIEAVSQSVRKSLMEVLVQTLEGRAYRLPVHFHKPEYEIYVEDGQEYYLVPASYKRGKTITLSGVLYRLRPVPPHVKVALEGEVYFAIPDKMSEELEEIYHDTATIEIDFTPQPVAYALVYQKSTNQILAYKYLGSAKTNEAGEIIDPLVKAHQAKNQAGQVALLQDEEIAAKLEGYEDLGEVIFFIDRNMGYRQGYFTKIWKYLSAQRGTTDAATRILMDHLQSKAAPGVNMEAIAQYFDKKAAREEAIKTKSVEPKRNPQKGKQEPMEKASLPLYRLREGMATQKYEGLYGADLFLVSEDNPLYPEYRDLLNIKPGEAVVLVGGPNGRPSKVPIRSIQGKSEAGNHSKRPKIDLSKLK